jgi:hypothetical protein
MSGTRPSTPVLLALLAAAVTVAVLGQVWLQATFATVRHPVPLGVASTTADPASVRGWYRVLTEQGTLDRMVAAELVDLVWIVGVSGSVVLLTLVAARLLGHRNPPAARLLRRLAPWTAVAPGLDVIENAFSFAMLARPLDVPAALAIGHAVVSWLKLAGMVSVGVGVLGYSLWSACSGGGGGRARRDRLPPRIAPAGPDRGVARSDR